MASNTILINGVDVRTQTGVKVVGDMGSLLYSPGTLRGQNDAVPGRRGQVGADLPLDAYTGDIQLQIGGATRHQQVTNLRAFLAAIRGGTLSSLCTLERRLDNGTTYDSHTAKGQLTGNPVSTLSSLTARTTLTVIQLDGAWWDSGSSAWIL